MIDKIKKELLDSGCKLRIIDGKEVFIKDNLYIRIDFVKDWNEYIIETAESKEDAEKNLFEDSDYIKITASDEEIKTIIASCLI
ncbi:hypothetical protein IJ162_01195 [Candidatus Saccharibacteria bacterium]|nr:hypothetical protein [Candidatus Saccharibacteria bacterium]